MLEEGVAELTVDTVWLVVDETVGVRVAVLEIVGDPVDVWEDETTWLAVELVVKVVVADLVGLGDGEDVWLLVGVSEGVKPWLQV